VWGGLVRMFLAHHVTWSVNSVCHLFGSVRFHTADESRNNAVVAVLTFGEGWHNNHHAFPSSARHGLRWWELDLTYALTRVLSLIGLITEIRVPTSQQVAHQRHNAERTADPASS
jgi:stearoyl-CoA desaturase (Delta-9 desaturase)